ncbi:quinone oxidoreductase family protein [Cryptosporangium arvum]|uniref:Zn-dependent oxidoreductase, NADPH:quinone reductase n=1 Tax=Cryptosporangium arvum DSM 44712 TaxID=927661 RepID=A0A010ZL39_9ACTN|nr:zinc-binding dehydrogenase [Cryptosporangium arvum]EXG79359.1 Zn-dependent oxidoreductase, NADPH:quinone reductase [Cryptosporangium arvum DSM 44712]
MRAIRITSFGGPEVLVPAELPDPVASGNAQLLDVSRAGVNYADTHQAENSYLAASSLPMVPGAEVVGRLADGRRIVSLLAGGGGYAEKALVEPGLSFDVPEGIDDTTALAMVVQGASAWLLLRRSAVLNPGESVVVHAAAGGVGSLAVQLAKAWGAGRVIATASSDEKRELARELGADVAIDSRSEDMTAALREANGGQRVDVVLDMTGGRVTDQSLRALAPFGRLAFYGMASREQPSPIELRNLLGHSTTVAGMWLAHAFLLPGDVLRPAIAELFEMVAKGTLRAVPGGEFALSEARKAHEALRSRSTVGKLVLDPSR